MENTDLQQQFNDKKRYITIIIDNVKENLKCLEESKKKSVKLEHDNILEKNKFTKDIYDYYNDLGVFFFKLKDKEEIKEEESLLSFLKNFFKKTHK